MGNQSPQEDDLDLDDFLAPFMGDEDSESQALSQHLDEVLSVAAESASKSGSGLDHDSDDADGLIPEPYIEGEEEEVFEVGFQGTHEADPSLTAINTDDGGHFERDDPEDLGAEIEVEAESLESDAHEGPAVEFDLDFNEEIEHDEIEAAGMTKTADAPIDLGLSNDSESDDSTEADFTPVVELEPDSEIEPAFELEAEIETDFEIEVTEEVEDSAATQEPELHAEFATEPPEVDEVNPISETDTSSDEILIPTGQDLATGGSKPRPLSRKSWTYLKIRNSWHLPR